MKILMKKNPKDATVMQSNNVDVLVWNKQNWLIVLLTWKISKSSTQL